MAWYMEPTGSGVRGVRSTVGDMGVMVGGGARWGAACHARCNML